MNAAAHVEIADHRHFARLAGSDQVVENFVGHGFVKGTLIAVRPQIEFERFELEANLIRYVGYEDRGKVGLAGPGADTSELRALHIDCKVAPRSRIGKGF